MDGKASVDSKARKSKKTSVLIMHGNIIKRPQVMIPADEDSSFSMLQANPDMF